MDRLMDWFGSDVYECRLSRIRRFWEGDGRIMVTVDSSKDSYRQVFDEERMRRLAPGNLEALARSPGCNLPAFFADFGTVSTARYWGGKTFFPNPESQNIFIDPAAQTLEAALVLTAKAIDDPEMDAFKALRLFRKLSEQLETDRLWLRTPDFQGTLNTAGLILNQEEMLMSMFSEPETVHKFLDKISDFLIGYFLYMKMETGNRICGNIWPYTFLPSELGASFTEDMMPLLGPDEYREFGIPYVEKMSRAFGSVLIHCCGEWGRHAVNLKKSSARIRAMEFHYPFTKLEEIEILSDTTVFVPYVAIGHDQVKFRTVTEYYEHLLESSDSKTRFWFPFTGESEEALAFARKYGF
ncbi:MAG: hypothetical protein WC637_07590 [Victivallales bacterium]|jgi:hypothetical protein